MEPQYVYRNPVEVTAATNRQYADKVLLITATPAVRKQYGFTTGDADRIIRAARRQLARYGPEVLTDMYAWCRTDSDRALVARALSKQIRVSTAVQEWEERTR